MTKPKIKITKASVKYWIFLNIGIPAFPFWDLTTAVINSFVI